ncbi:hypothetical protein [Ekhidna sp. To15]|uniref:hypothetical protein n=1 Tax=Ekhidna sp. To15 TaxID=3395267 RepID=UPI003F523DBF
MAKKKGRRKPKPRQPQPLSLARKSQMIDAFYNRLLEICETFGAREAVEKISIGDIYILYSLRFRFKVLGGPEMKLLPGIVGTVRKIIEDLFLDQQSFKFPGSSTEIPNREFFSHVLTLYHWYRTLDDVTPEQKQLLDEKLKPMVELCKSKNSPERNFERFMDTLGSMLTQTPDRFMVYVFKDTHSGELSKKLYMGIHVMVRCFLTETKKIRFDGRDTTEVFKVEGWKKGGIEIPHLKADDLSDNTIMRGLKLEVYMQKHALNRLYERLDLFPKRELYYHVTKSITVGNVLPFGINRGLLGYYFYGHLLGYLLVEVIDGVAVIRTFLFLTNDDTPQGKKLQQLLKLNKLDKSYTGLDQLNTFIFGDIKKDDRLYSILKEAECSILLNLHENIIERATQKDVILDAASIKKYFKVEGD